VQGSLTDAQSKRILQDIIAPHFRQNDFYGGLVAGVSAIAALVDAENLPKPAQAAQQSEEDGGWWPILLFFIFLILMRMMARGSRRHALGANDWGRTAGIIIGNEIGRRGGFGGGGFGGGGFGGGSGGYSGGGGTFDGGGASGNW
jgi:uncharacterized protein